MDDFYVRGKKKGFHPLPTRYHYQEDAGAPSPGSDFLYRLALRCE